jgi:hypothetical protein
MSYQSKIVMQDPRETKGAELVGSDFSFSGHVDRYKSLKEKRKTTLFRRFEYGVGDGTRKIMHLKVIAERFAFGWLLFSNQLL